MVFNLPKETRMDTQTPEGKDFRAGHRIEIQALTLRMLNLAKKLNKKNSNSYSKYNDMEDKLKRNVLSTMMINGKLIDGIDESGNPDFTIRPNVFLAYYIYPELLSKKDWEATFDYVLEKCWLEWGGLSSISKKDSLFMSHHTGIDNRSYHRGDSWFFLNNIAAICMLDVNLEKYKGRIKKIKDASLQEMKFKGFIGQCAELSEASSLKSTGCLAQAWSASTLLELLKKTRKL